MNTRRSAFAFALVLGWACLAAQAADYRVEVLKEGPPADELVKPILERLQPTGVRVIRGTSRVLCDIWLCKELEAKPDFTPRPELLYPFQVGQLIGVIRYVNKGADFRNQDIPKGVYTLRYDLQPMDGNHEGTSPTRDFLLLVRAEDDPSADAMAEDDLWVLSADAVETGHPGLLCLQKAEGDASQAPQLRHNEDRDWWILRLIAPIKQGDQKKSLPLDVVIVGFTEF